MSVKILDINETLQIKSNSILLWLIIHNAIHKVLWDSP